MRTKAVAGALGLLLVMTGVALADLATAQRYLKWAREEAEKPVPIDEIRTFDNIAKAKKEMEGLDAATRAPLEQEIKAIEGLAAAKVREGLKPRFLKRIERAVFGVTRDAMLRDYGLNAYKYPAVARERLEELYRDKDAYCLDPPDKAELERQLEAFKGECDTQVVETHFKEALKYLERIESSEIFGEDHWANFKKEIDEHLKQGNVPQNDPRVAEYRDRLRKGLDARQRGLEDKAKEDKLRELTNDWDSLKGRFARDCPAWDTQLGNDYGPWVRSKEHGLEKALKRWEFAGEMLEDSDYKDCANFYRDDATVVKVMTEVQTWRREAADRLCKKADELLAEAEKKAGDAEQRPALEALVADLERLAPEAANGAATLARAKAVLGGSSGGGTVTVDAPEGGSSGASEREGGGGGLGTIVKVLLGLVCCFGFLGIVGAGGFFAYKQMNAAKAPPPGAPPAA